MKIAVVGAGAMGRWAVKELGLSPDVAEIVVGDYNEDQARGGRRQPRRRQGHGPLRRRARPGERAGRHRRLRRHGQRHAALLEHHRHARRGRGGRALHGHGRPLPRDQAAGRAARGVPPRRRHRRHRHGRRPRRHQHPRQVRRRAARRGRGGARPLRQRRRHRLEQLRRLGRAVLARDALRRVQRRGAGVHRRALGDGHHRRRGPRGPRLRRARRHARGALHDPLRAVHLLAHVEGPGPQVGDLQARRCRPSSPAQMRFLNPSA